MPNNNQQQPLPYIENEQRYFAYIVAQGVGANDEVEGATPRSYISYMNGASRTLNHPISPELFPNLTEEDWECVSHNIMNCMQHRQYAERYRRNMLSAMRHYFEMLKADA